MPKALRHARHLLPPLAVTQKCFPHCMGTTTHALDCDSEVTSWSRMFLTDAALNNGPTLVAKQQSRC